MTAARPGEPGRRLSSGSGVFGLSLGGGLAFGGDYNPEQWPESVWIEDVRLMQEAGVNLVTVGVFSWALLEPAEGRYEFGWLDRVLDLLHSGGIAVDLATATASPPPWFSRAHPESLLLNRDGNRVWPGGRQGFCPSSPVYRDRSLALAGRLAERYRDHPALAMWHVGNELGCHNAHCYCDVSAAAFRRWLADRYGGVKALNEAWGTAFWSQHYGDWDEVLPPRIAAAHPNPTQQLDFRRFSSDQLLANFVAERDLLHEVTPGVPVTTNLMVTWSVRDMDYWRWAPQLDLVANDHYLRAEDPDAHVELAFSADLTRSLAGGGPWLLMEHSTGAVNWQPRNLAKRPGQLRRNSLQHVARGSDGALFFQWRASQAGAEKYHSAMLPHGGTRTRVWREVRELGADLARLGEVAGTRIDADVAVVFDWQAWWATELDSHPSVDVTYLDQARAFHAALWELGVAVDLVHPEAALDGYRLVIVPTLYCVSDTGAQRLAEFVSRGGTAVVTYFSGIADENDHVRLGGYPGAYRDLLGVWVEEFHPLRENESVVVTGLRDGGADGGADGGTRATVWTEELHLAGAESVAAYADGPLPGVPAVTRHRPHGEESGGSAWYVATRLDDDGLRALLAPVLAEAGVAPVVPTRPGVEVVRRTGSGKSYMFVINHTDEPASVPVTGTELLTGIPAVGGLTVPAGAVRVVRETVADPASSSSRPDQEGKGEGHAGSAASGRDPRARRA